METANSVLTKGALIKLTATTLIGAGSLLLLGLLSNSAFLQEFSLQLWLPMWLLTCFMYGWINVLKQLPWLQRWNRVVNKTDDSLQKFSGNFYGAIAGAMYLVLEIRRLQEDWLPHDDQPVLAQLFRNLLDFGIDSVMNLVWSVAWPAFYSKAYSSSFWMSIGLTIGVFYLAWWLLGAHRGGRACNKPPTEASS
jgi:hypothetical protein